MAAALLQKPLDPLNQLMTDTAAALIRVRRQQSEIPDAAASDLSEDASDHSSRPAGDKELSLWLIREAQNLGRGDAVPFNKERLDGERLVDQPRHRVSQCLIDHDLLDGSHQIAAAARRPCHLPEDTGGACHNRPQMLPRRPSRGIRTVAIGAASVLAALTSVTVAHTQGAPIPADVITTLTRGGGSSPDDITMLQAGRVVVRTAMAAERPEASVIAAVRINTSLERTLAYFRQLIAYVDGQVTLQYGTVTRPAEDADFRSATLDAADIADLRACVATACDIRIGTATIPDLRTAVDWTAPNANELANGWMRRTLVSAVNGYQRAGDAALRAYDERGEPIDMAALWDALEHDSPIPAAIAPGLQRYLGRYPGAVPAEAANELYWDTQRFTSLKPVIGVTHLVTWREAATPQRVIVAQKQILATHYFFGALAVTLFVQDNATPPATYVVYTNRTRGDLLRGTQASTQSGIRGRLSGISAGVQRRLGEQMVRQSAERLMTAMKDALER